MTIEGGRKIGRKRVQLGGGYVDVPVIMEISFVDPRESYQETRFTIDNSARSARTAHVVSLRNSADTASLDVERIDKWPVYDLVSKGQETVWSIDNVTGEGSSPPHFSTHLKTHVFRYQNPSDEDLWIDSELIDEAIFIGENGQEILFTLANPDLQVDDSVEEISDSINGIDPAWRVDPFQNFIDFSEGGETVNWIRLVWNGHYSYPFLGDVGGSCYPATIQWSFGDSQLVGQYQGTMEWQGAIFSSYPSTLPPGSVVTGAPTFTSEMTFGEWEYFIFGIFEFPHGKTVWGSQTATFDFYAQPISYAPGCYGNTSVPSTGSLAAGTCGDIVPAKSATIDASGVSLAVDGITWDLYDYQLTAGAQGLTAVLYFHRPP